MDPRTTGIYYVGKDVKAGEYKILPSNDENSHYWAIYSNLSISDMKKDSYFDNQEYVSLEDNTYFVMMNAHFEDEDSDSIYGLGWVSKGDGKTAYYPIGDKGTKFKNVADTLFYIMSLLFLLLCQVFIQLIQQRA